jgi:hypothetical protein
MYMCARAAVRECLPDVLFHSLRLRTGWDFWRSDRTPQAGYLMR